MKNKLLLITVALALPAMAGTPEQVTSAPSPASPSLWSWFIGGTAGYLVDAEEGYYSGQVGVDTPWNFGGWNVAMYAEVGYTQADNRDGASFYNVDTDVVPVTFNFKLERPISGNLGAYLGVNLGAASLDINANPFMGAAAGSTQVSDDAWVFTTSVFGGLVYNVSPAFEVFGGVRWIYMDDTDIRGVNVELSDDVLFEAGLRFNF
jgi:opacity protein-like surface antigen